MLINEIGETIMNIRSIGSNQTLLTTNHGDEVLYSYETAVAGHHHTIGDFKTSKRYSNTTTKHINKYLNGVKAVVLSPEQIEQLFNEI